MFLCQPVELGQACHKLAGFNEGQLWPSPTINGT